jgi:hypothetical protein
MILLTDEERERLASYLEQDAESTLGLVEQMRKINLPEAVIKLKLTEVAAQKIVVKMLRSTKSMSI